ncbi:helix-turn-helix domain-containing protein [Bacillus suaedae]|uniref:Helix-turn-helix domain-containing protein n=1 Tax=Halalkalibacter suaedae TaxID=2822140 RepID=A0A941AMR1_9BACI|nr:helix-turn-helix domain-containing protein [Bacillus suaedae]MBP3950111.1 helix-turn-helix domain-containing protein [Bacillus suaedae]
MEENYNELGLLLKGLLKEQSLSMRKLSQITGIDPAVISKIINGKRKATPDHLEKFAEQLPISITKLYKASGYPVDRKQSDLSESVDHIHLLLETSNFVDREFRVEEVKNELTKYQHLALKEEGTQMVLGQFEEKMEKVGSVGPFIHHLKNMYERFSKKNGSKRELALMGGALLYFIVAVDCIPDYLFPVGYIDDAFVINLVLNGLSIKKF